MKTNKSKSKGNSKSKLNNSSTANGSGGALKNIMSRLANLRAESSLNDILSALKEDHDVLKKLGKTLTSEDANDSEKKEAYANFSTLLKSHAKSEEKAVYERCCPVEDITQEAEEGYVEHNIADTLMKNIAGTRNKDKWNAMVKVLAEVVEHHAEEEEKELFPKIREHFEKEEQKQMSHKFISLREQSQKGVNEENAGVLAELQGQSSASARA